MLLCFVAEHAPDIVLLDHQFDLPKGPVWWGSVEIVSEWLNKKKSGADHVTLFFSTALIRYCAPWSPILLLARYSVVTVYGHSE